MSYISKIGHIANYIIDNNNNLQNKLTTYNLQNRKSTV